MEKMIGILMLETKFHRPVGDIGNPDTFSFPVVYKIVEGATINRVVKEGDTKLIQPFIDAAKELQDQGVRAITTSCGFLSAFQKEIQNELSIPFLSSSLLQIEIVKNIIGGTVGVITASEFNLTEKHFSFLNNTKDINIVIKGMDDMPYFTEAIVNECMELNMDEVSREMQKVTSRLLEENPEVTAIILECTNMPPYREAIQEVTTLPIFDISTLVNYLYQTL